MRFLGVARGEGEPALACAFVLVRMMRSVQFLENLKRRAGGEGGKGGCGGRRTEEGRLWRGREVEGEEVLVQCVGALFFSLYPFGFVFFLRGYQGKGGCIVYIGYPPLFF